MRRAALGLLVMLVWIPAGATAGGKKIGDKTSQEWVKILHTHEKEKVRRAAVLVMELFGRGERGVVDALIKSFREDESPAIKIAAAQVLARFGEDGKDAVPAFVEALKSEKSAEVRRAAAKALGGKMAKHAKAAIVTLGAALKDPDEETRTAAAASLKDFGEDAMKVEKDLLAALKDSEMDRFTRFYAAQILIQHSDKADTIVPIFLSVLKEKDAHTSLHRLAVDGLAHFGEASKPAVEPLLNLFQNYQKPLLLRQSAGLALAKIQPPSEKVWPVCKELMDDPLSAIRSQALRLASKLCGGEAELVPALIKRCQDVSMEVQVAAIQALGEIGPAAKAAEGTLEQLSKSAARPEVRKLAASVLKKVQGN